MGLIILLGLIAIGQLAFLGYLGKLLFENYQASKAKKQHQPVFINKTAAPSQLPFQMKKKEVKPNKKQLSLLRRIDEIKKLGITDYDLSEFNLFDDEVNETSTFQRDLQRKRG